MIVDVHQASPSCMVGGGVYALSAQVCWIDGLCGRLWRSCGPPFIVRAVHTRQIGIGFLYHGDLTSLRVITSFTPRWKVNGVLRYLAASDPHGVQAGAELAVRPQPRLPQPKALPSIAAQSFGLEVAAALGTWKQQAQQ